MSPETQASPLTKYAQLKSGILECIDGMLSVESIRGCPCEEIRDKVRENAFNLVVVGQFKRGKTSLINALLGADILPVAVVPLTSIVTIITYGEALRIRVSFSDGKTAEIRPESLAEYVTEKGNPQNVKHVDEVVLTYPSPYLKDGVRLIDTPGVGSVYQHNTDVAYRYLPKSDAALFLLSVDQPPGKAELDFLRDVTEYSSKIFFLLNKADYLRESDLRESVAFSSRVLTETMGSEARLFPVSARLALEGARSKSGEMTEQSLLPRFTEELHRFLMEEKGTVLIRSAANNLLRVLSQAKLELALEMKSITTPLDELEEKLRAFEGKRRETELAKQDFVILLDGETKRLAQNVLDEDITRFRKELLAREEVHLGEQFDRLNSLPSRELRSGLETTVVDHVRLAFNAWRALEDDKLAKAFTAICGRYTSNINDTVDSLLKFASDLFEIPFEAVGSGALWSDKSRFSYKFREEPVGLQIVASSLTVALPKFISDKIILKQVKEFLRRAVDTQAGRLGADFEERLDRSRLDFRWEMINKIEAAIEGMSVAIEKGIQQKSKGGRAIAEATEMLAGTAARLDAISAKLVAIREQTGGVHD